MGGRFVRSQRLDLKNNVVVVFKKLLFPLLSSLFFSRTQWRCFVNEVKVERKNGFIDGVRERVPTSPPPVSRVHADAIHVPETALILPHVQHFAQDLIERFLTLNSNLRAQVVARLQALFAGSSASAAPWGDSEEDVVHVISNVLRVH